MNRMGREREMYFKELAHMIVRAGQLTDWKIRQGLMVQS